tara:strand:+ start:2382 stop:2801 length:420 start_codon:yes stop_codon:yes gene_type:complete
MILNVHEVLDLVRKARTKEKKVELLLKHESWALKDILRGTFDSTIEWNLPAGEPPWTPSESHSAPTNLHKAHKEFVYFVKGLRESEKLTPVKRESIFIGLIEGIDPDDAKLVIGMINKDKPTGITRPVIEEAFPKLLAD